MRYFGSLATVSLLAALLLTGCGESASSVEVKNRQTAQTNNKTTSTAGSTDSHDHAAEDSIKRVTVEQAKAAVDAGTALIIDVRGDEAYKAKHIKGSISVPDAANGYQKLPKDKQIIAYCS